MDVDKEREARETLARHKPEFLSHHDEEMSAHGALAIHLGHHAMHEEGQQHVKNLMRMLEQPCENCGHIADK